MSNIAKHIAVAVRGIRGRGPKNCMVTTDSAGNYQHTLLAKYPNRQQTNSIATNVVQSNGANPTAVAGPAAVDGTATTFMTSDSAPAVQKCSASQFGICEPDGTTISSSGGVLSVIVKSTFAFPPVTAPSAPASGFIMYCDTADNKLKVIAASSVVTILATQ